MPGIPILAVYFNSLSVFFPVGRTDPIIIEVIHKPIKETFRPRACRFDAQSLDSLPIAQRPFFESIVLRAHRQHSEYVEDLRLRGNRRRTRFRDSRVLNQTRPFESVHNPVKDAVGDTELLPKLLMQDKCGVVANILA